MWTERGGWYAYDWANSAFHTTVISVFLGPHLNGVAKAAADPHGFVHPFGLDVRAAAVFPFAITFSVLGQVLLLPLVGAVADHTGRKRELLAFFAGAGSLATMGMFAVTGERYLLGAALLIVGNLAMGASTVVYNAFLPDIAGPGEADAVSTRGWAWGYLGGGLLLALNLAVYLTREPLGLTADLAVRINLLSAGLWWAGFTLIPLWLLRNRAVRETGEGLGAAVVASLGRLRRTLAGARANPAALRFLLAFLLYNDGVQTVVVMSATYAHEELLISGPSIVTAVLMVQFVAFGGVLLAGELARRHGARNTVLGSLVVWTAAIGATLLLERGSVVQFLALSAVIGLVMGGTQALSRSLFTRLLPPGQAAEYFGFYEIGDKGSSWFGPLLFGLTLHWTGDYRAALVSLTAFFLVGFLLLLAVRVPPGHGDRTARPASGQRAGRIGVSRSASRLRAAFRPR